MPSNLIIFILLSSPLLDSYLPRNISKSLAVSYAMADSWSMSFMFNMFRNIIIKICSVLHRLIFSQATHKMNSVTFHGCRQILHTSDFSALFCVHSCLVYVRITAIFVAFDWPINITCIEVFPMIHYLIKRFRWKIHVMEIIFQILKSTVRKLLIIYLL